MARRLKRSGRSDGSISIRFVAAKTPVDLAYDDPDHQTTAPAIGETLWTALPVPEGQAVHWSRQIMELRREGMLPLFGVSLVFFTFRQPDIQVPDIEDITIQRWDAERQRWFRVPTAFSCDDSQRHCLAVLLDSGYVSLVCRFKKPVTVALLRIKVGHPPRQCILHTVLPHTKPLVRAVLASAELGRYVRARQEYDDFVSREFPGLTAEIEACPAEDATDFFRRRLKPYRGRALLGLKDDIVETGVDWNHTVMEERVKGVGRTPGVPLIISFWVGDPPRAFGDLTGQSARRGLTDGWLPWVNTAYRAEGVEYRLTTFVQPFSGKNKNTFTRIRCEAINHTKAKRTAVITIAAAALRKLCSQTWRLEDMKLRRRSGVLYDSASAPVMYIPAGGRFQSGCENVLCYKRVLPPGSRHTLEFAIPRLASPSPDCRTVSRPGSFDQAAQALRHYWRDILSRGAEVRLPDAWMNTFWKNSLTQFFITATGDRMSYGAFPSRYDGSVFGIEEGWTMQALACAGYKQDALRYFSNTYLTDANLDKANYHRQYRKGITLTYAYSLFRLAGDEAWLRERIERLRVEAEWIISSRRKTMQTFGGVRPLHWGLLPHHVYGGDVNKPAYSLHPNAVSWRGLRDFGLMLRALGAPDADRYLREADAYKRRIESVIKRTIHRGDGETFLSMKLYWTEAYPYNDVFWPLFCSMLLETGVMDPSAADTQGLLTWMRRRAKTLAGLPVLYPMRLDPTYGLGIAMINLRAGHIDEYLKTVAAYRSFLTDPCFYTSPESGDLCLRDEDGIWEIRSEENTWRQWMNPSSPLTSYTAVIFLLLRHILIMEERDAAGATNGRLLLMPAFPLAWYQKGQRVRVLRQATEYGDVSYDFSSPGNAIAYRCQINFAPNSGCRELGVRIRTLVAGRTRCVDVNSRRCNVRADASGTLWFRKVADKMDICILE